MSLYDIFPVKEVSGDIVTFEDGADGIPMESIIASIYPIQSGSGDPSPENIRPISGMTGLSVYVSPTSNVADATTYAFDWSTQAGTVYGGTLDVVTGLLTVDTAIVTITGGTTVSSPKTSRYKIGDLNTVVPSGDTDKSICNVLKKHTGEQSIQADSFTIVNSESGNGDYVNIRFSGADSATSGNERKNLTNQILEQLNNDGTPLQLVYELATPLTYQLTPQEVKTLLGLNNVWGTVAPITVKYHSQDQDEARKIDRLFVDGVDMQADGWFLRWRKLAAPKPKTDYVSVWGRDGDVDLTESETGGQVFYENRNLTMDMIYIGDDWTGAYSDLLDMLHGKNCMVQFSSDPYWYWTGRVVASLFEHKPHSLSMDGSVFPYKLSIIKTTASTTVNGVTEGNAVDVVLPGSRMRVSPKVTVTAGTGESVTLKWGSKTQTLSAGTYYVRGLKVGREDVIVKVYGTGTVDFEYRKGML